MIIKFYRVAVNTYVPIFRGLDACSGRKLRVDTHTRDNYSNPRCACEPKVNKLHLFYGPSSFRCDDTAADKQPVRGHSGKIAFEDRLSVVGEILQ